MPFCVIFSQIWAKINYSENLYSYNNITNLFRWQVIYTAQIKKPKPESPVWVAMKPEALFAASKAPIFQFLFYAIHKYPKFP